MLMDGDTFSAIKDRLEELGAVGPSGLDARLHRRGQAWWRLILLAGRVAMDPLGVWGGA